MNISLGDNRTLTYGPAGEQAEKAADASAKAASMRVQTAAGETEDRTEGLRTPLSDTAPIVMNALAEAGLEATERNSRLVSALIDHMMSVDRTSVRQLYSQTRAYPDADPDMLCLMNRNHIPVNSASVSSMEHFLKNETMLFNALEDVFDDIEGLLNGAGQTQGNGLPAERTWADSSLVNQSAYNAEAENVILSATDPERETNGSRMDEGTPEPAAVEQTATEPDHGAGSTLGDVAEYTSVTGTDGSIVDEAVRAHDGKAAAESAENSRAVSENGSITEETADHADMTAADALLEHPAAAAVEDLADRNPADRNPADRNPAAITGTKQENAKEALARFVNDITERDEALADSIPAGAPDSAKNGSVVHELRAKVMKLREKLALGPEEINRDSVKKLYEQISELLKKAGEAADEAGSKTMKTHILRAARTLEFMEDAGSIWPYIEIPVKLKDDDTQAGLYVYPKEAGRKIDPKNCTALIHIEMPHLGLMDIRLALTGSELDLMFSSQEAASRLLRENIGELQSALLEKGYNAQPKFEIRTVEPEKKSEEIKQDTAKPLSFDVRA